MTGVDPGVNCRVHQDIHERLFGTIVAEQDHGQPAQGEVLRHVVARLSGHDNIRARGDSKLAKVAQGAAEDCDSTAHVVGFAPHARVAAKGSGDTGSKVAQAAGVVEVRECAQAAGLGSSTCSSELMGSAPSSSLRQARASCERSRLVWSEIMLTPQRAASNSAALHWGSDASAGQNASGALM